MNRSRMLETLLKILLLHMMGTPIRHGLPEIVRALKTFSARRINAPSTTRLHTLGHFGSQAGAGS